MSEPELLPCPFCGGGGDMSYYATATSPDPAGRFVECESCSASGPQFEIQGEAPDRDEYTQAQAIAAWIQRAPLYPDPSELIEALEGIRAFGFRHTGHGFSCAKLADAALSKWEKASKGEV